MFCGGEDSRCGMYEHPYHMWHECSSIPLNLYVREVAHPYHTRCIPVYLVAAIALAACPRATMCDN